MPFTGPRPKTTARGLGAAHAKRVKAMPPAQGEPCYFCGEAMWPGKVWTGKRYVSVLEADHVTPRALGGGNGPLRWTHRMCNRRAGSVLGAQIVNANKQVTAIRW